MEWPLFAVAQMLITTVAVGVAFWLRNRALQKQNDLLRAHLKAISGDTAPNFEDLIAALDGETPTAPIVKLVLEHCASPADDLEERLRACVSQSGLAADPEALAAATAEIGELKQQLAEFGTGDEGELKTLLMQFTNDSREMMACIQNLETENAELRAQLGLDPETADAGDAAEDSAPVADHEPRDDSGTNETQADDDATAKYDDSTATKNAEDAA